MISRPRTARIALVAVLALVGTTVAMTVVGLPSNAGPLGDGETSLSGTTTPFGIGETAVARAPGHDKNLVVWEGAREVATMGSRDGIKREIFGQYVSSLDGSKLGSPVTLATFGETNDATQDVVDPALSTRSDGVIVLVFAADPIPDSVPIGSPVDTTGFEIYASLIHPGDPLIPVTAVQVSDVAGDNPAYDQRHPDVVGFGTSLRFVWEGDSDTNGGEDGRSDIWTALLPESLGGNALPQLVSTRQTSGTQFDNTRPRVSAASSALVVWEGVDVVTEEIPVRRIWGARLLDLPGSPQLIGSSSLDGNLEELSPDVVWDADALLYNVVWSGDTDDGGGAPGDSRIWQRWTTTDGAHMGSAHALTDGTTRDTLPSVVQDQGRNQFVLAWVGRGPTGSGPGHHELYTGRWKLGLESLTPTKLEQDRLSTVDANVSAVNAEALRPNLDYHPASKTVYAAWARDTFTSGAGVAGRLLAPRVDLSVTVTASPTNPSPARDGLNPADALTFSVKYANKTGSSNPTNDIEISLGMAAFVRDEIPVTFTDIVGETPTYTCCGHVTIPSLAPGDSGTVVFHGTLEPGLTDGSVQTATAAITTGDIVDDPTPLDNSDNVGVTTDYPPSVVSITRTTATPTNATSVAWKVRFDQTVSNVGTADFATAGSTAGASVTDVSCSGVTCIVTADAGTTDGTIEIVVPDDATIIDLTGKSLAMGNLPFGGPEYVVDRTSPTVEVVSEMDDPTNDNPLAFGLEFSEPVTGLTLGELTVVNGEVGQLTGSGDTRSVLVNPSGDGDVKLGVPAGVALDAAENGNLVSENLSRAYDGTRPELVLGTPGAPQNGPFEVTVSASESVTGFLLDDVTVDGGNASDLTGDGPWAFTVNPDTEGEVDVDVRADAVTDQAGNGSLATSESVTYDVTRPSVTVDSSASNPTGTSPIPFTLTFDEPVTGLTVDELTVTGGTATMSGSGTTRAVEVTPSGDGKVSVTVPPDVAADAAGNTNTLGERVTRTYDTSGPAATISTTALDPTNDPVIPVTVTWDESVTGFTSDDVVLTNGTLSDFAGSGSTYTFDVTATADGQVRVAVPAGAVTDASDNQSPGATPLNTQVDTTSPTGEATSTVSGLTNAADVPVTVTFDEPVTGLDLDDLTLVNATAADLTGSSDSYELTVEPTLDGEFSVVVPAGAATDSAGNDSLATAELSWTSDRTSPAAELTYTGPATVNAPVLMALHLSDDAVLEEGDFETTNATVSVEVSVLVRGAGCLFATNVNGSTSCGTRDYTVLVTPTADGPFSVKLKAGSFTDAAANPNTASAERGATYDGSAPTVTELTAPGSANQPYDVQVVFSEDVLGFDLPTVVVDGGTASDLTGSDDEWGFTVTPTADGPVSVSLPSGTAYDSAGNSSEPAGPALTTYDATRPTVVVDSPAPAATGTSPIAVSITFSEPVTGFVEGDLEVTNGAPMSFSGAGTSYTVDIVPASEGDVTVNVPDSAGDDAVGNGSVASNLLTREFDSSRPTVAMTTTAGNPTNRATIPVSVEFSKPVHGFEDADLIADGGSVSDFTQVDARTWTFTLTPAGDGPVSVEIPENSAASNANNLAFGATLDITSDRTAPVLTLTPPARPTIGGPVVFVLVSDEPVVGLDLTDVRLGGTSKPATATLVPVSATRWRISVSGMTNAGKVSVTLPEGATSDLASNPSARVVALGSWNPSISFAFLQQPVTRWGYGVAIPTSVTGPGPIVFSATSSDENVLPVSQITMTSSGAVRRIMMFGDPGAPGWSDVVLTADFGGIVRTIPLRFTTGTAGADRLVGTPSTDVMLGLQGDDTIWGTGGSDILYAGYGDDRVYAGAGRDLLAGAYGHDVLFGGPGADAFLVFPDDSRPDFDPTEDVLLDLPTALLHLFAR